MTLTQDIELPDQGFTPECRDLLEGLLKREVHERLGCRGKGYVENNAYTKLGHAVHFCVEIKCF